MLLIAKRVRCRAISGLVAATLLTCCSSLQAVDDERAASYADFIEATGNFEDDEFTDIVIEELHDYLLRFPDADNLPQMHFKVATIYWDQQREEDAFFTHMALLYLYPDSELIPQVRDRLRTLILQEGEFENLREDVDAVLHPAMPDSGRQAAHFQLIRDLSQYDVDDINGLLLGACDTFERLYPASSHADDVLYLKADLLMRDDEARQALAQYLKLTYIYDKSVYVTACKLKIAELLSKELDMHQQAVLALEEFLLEHPEDPQAPQAQFRIGEITEEELDKHLEAINAYTRVAEKYPKSVEAVPALFRAALLYENEFKEYDQAVRVYTEIVRDFAEDPQAPFALTEAARIYEKRLDDYANAANVYFKVYGFFPDDKITPEAVYAAAEITEDKLEDYEKAIEYYRIVADRYSDHQRARDAARRIEKLTKEIAKKN